MKVSKSKLMKYRIHTVVFPMGNPFHFWAKFVPRALFWSIKRKCIMVICFSFMRSCTTVVLKQRGHEPLSPCKGPLAPFRVREEGVRAVM